MSTRRKRLVAREKNALEVQSASRAAKNQTKSKSLSDTADEMKLRSRKPAGTDADKKFHGSPKPAVMPDVKNISLSERNKGSKRTEVFEAFLPLRHPFP